MRARFPFFCILLAVLIFSASSLWGQDGLRGAVSRSGNSTGLLSSVFESNLAAADFDNDQKPDGALLREAGIIDGQRVYRIELHVTAGENQNLLFASSESALSISALDVNRDGTPDLIVEQAFTHKRLQVWLNDGHGGFRPVRVGDFPPVNDVPAKWRDPNLRNPFPALGLPPKNQTQQAVALFQVLRFSSSSSHWRNNPEARSNYGCLNSSNSPRAPPSCLPLASAS